ncbi:MAG TPA: nucleotidyltransferase [Polyangia bacterium]
MNNQLAQVLSAAIRAVESLRLRYALVGGLALAARGVTRATRDVDLFVAIPDQGRPRLQAALEAEGFQVPALEEELTTMGVFRSRHRGAGLFLDIFNAAGELGDAILDHCTPVQVAKLSVKTARAEEIAILKVFSDRPRDTDDLRRLLAASRGSLDLAYLRKWAAVLDASLGSDEVSKRLADAIATVGSR